MYRAVVVSVIIGTALVAGSDDLVQKCHDIDKPATLLCCATTITKPGLASAPEVKECFDKPQSPYSCDFEECVAKTQGYYGDGKNISKERITSFFESKYEKDPKLLALIKEKCINYDIARLGPPDTCIYKKMKYCVYNQLFLYCPEWKNEGQCSGIQKTIEDCAMKY